MMNGEVHERTNGSVFDVLHKSNMRSYVIRTLESDLLNPGHNVTHSD